MANFSDNKNKIYFDALCRTKKSESVLSLIHATYQVRENFKNLNGSEIKEKIAARLKNAYHLFKNTAGTYQGNLGQFSSQYTIGHELAIWKNSQLELTELAKKVAENRITIRDYFDIVFLNYIQPINNRVIHFLYYLLEEMIEKKINRISKEALKNLYKRKTGISEMDDIGDINGLCNMLISTNYFKLEERELVYIFETSMEDLIKRCDISYITRSYDEAREQLKDEEKYIEYLLKDNRKKYTDTSESQDILVNEGKNILYYGVPGVGKSYFVKELIKGSAQLTQRLVFHPDYTHSDFVGQIQPSINDEGKLIYEFHPGPFTKILKQANANTSKKYYLIIEEINRGNAPAIFGEIFQLLDRDESGKSEYEIINYDIAKEVYNDKEKHIYIPSNLTIIGTMNTADQNVFTLDTAFQRRWEMKDIENNISNSSHAQKIIEGTEITWEAFSTTVNELVVEENKDFSNFGDKRLGAYFIKENELSIELFSAKVIKYLWYDVFCYQKSLIFKSEIETLEEILKKYRTKETTEDRLSLILNEDAYKRMLDKVKNET